MQQQAITHLNTKHQFTKNEKVSSTCICAAIGSL